MNFNTSPIAFYPSRAAQSWRAWFAQRKISVICGNDILPFYIIDSGEAPLVGELYEPNSDTKVADITLSPYLLNHDIIVDGQSMHIWIYQGGNIGVFGYTNPGYYYLKIGSWYSDIFYIGDLPAEYTEVSWQFFDDIITADGTPISKHIKYKQIFDVPIWHPSYNVEEEGKTNNGIFFAMQQTTKKTSGFSTIVNEAQVDCLNLARMADNITIKTCINGVTKTMQTNQFEITSKWESDDIASIECQFDLFSIIRKYQQSNVEPEPLPIPVPPTPTSNYYIKGTAIGNSIEFTINGESAVIPVINGEYNYGYDTKLTSFSAYAADILTIDFSESCKMTNVTSFSLAQCQKLTAADFTNCTFDVCVDMQSAFENCKELLSVSMPTARFTANTDFGYAFRHCEKIQQISMPMAMIDKEVAYMFWNCIRLVSVNLASATLSHTLSAMEMFAGCKRLIPSGINMPLATFERCTVFDNTFGAFCQVNTDEAFVMTDVFPSYQSAQVGTIQGMFIATNLKTIDISAIDLSNCTSMRNAFNGDRYLQSLAFDKTHTTNVVDWSGAFAQTRPSMWAYLSDADFASAEDINAAFAIYRDMGVTKGAMTINATFDNVTTAQQAFVGYGAQGANGNWLSELNLPNATLEDATTIESIFANNDELETIYAPSINLLASVNANAMFANLPKLKNVTIGIASTMKQNVSLAQSPLLTETSITNIVAWLKDLTGATAKTVTFNSTAWNNLPAASQQTIASAIAAKNWVLQN